MSSASRKVTYSPVAALTPTLRVGETPLCSHFSRRMRWSRSEMEETTHVVSSVEPSSTTIISASMPGSLWTDARASAMNRAPL
jgi:hypothetical protein